MTVFSEIMDTLPESLVLFIVTTIVTYGILRIIKPKFIEKTQVPNKPNKPNTHDQIRTIVFSVLFSIILTVSVTYASITIDKMSKNKN